MSCLQLHASSLRSLRTIFYVTALDLPAHAGDDKENNSHDALRAAPQNGTGDQSDRPTNGAGSAAAHDTPRSKGIWGQGRVTLVGDAAHATINNG